MSSSPVKKIDEFRQKFVNEQLVLASYTDKYELPKY